SPGWRRRGALVMAQQTSIARQPRGIVQLGGVTVPGWSRWQVNNNSYYEADTFRIEYAASAMQGGYDAAWLSQQKEIFASIFAGLPADPDAPSKDDLELLIYGRVDRFSFDPVGGILTLTGRDLTGAFIDKKSATSY